MARQNINVGTGPNSLDGDVLRNAFIKANDNFVELYLYNQATPYVIEEISRDLLLNGTHTGITTTYDSQTHSVSLSATGEYTPADPTSWNGPAPTTLADAIDRLAAVIKTLNGGTGA